MALSVPMMAPSRVFGANSDWARQAGKHVYVEKPPSHYIWEG
jgi:hypothetical protein